MELSGKVEGDVELSQNTLYGYRLLNWRISNVLRMAWSIKLILSGHVDGWGRWTNQKVLFA